MAHITDKQSLASSMMEMAPGMKGMGPDMMKMSPEMMKGMMGSEMMGMGSDMMKGMMGSGMGNAARETAKVVVVTGGARHGILGNLIRNPFVLLGLGFAAGYMIYKYRKDIVSETKTN